MGTSSLYCGPKRTVLLPSDYDPDDNPSELDPTIEQPEPEEQDSSASDNENIDGGREEEKTTTSNQSSHEVSWSGVRRSITNAMNHRTARNIKGAIRNYTKALGGHTNATHQAKTARYTAVKLFSYFSGTPEIIRNRFEEAGIRFENRTTKDILNDICLLLAPVPNDIEDSLANIALDKTIADVAMNESVDLSLLNSFNEELLKEMVGGFMKHYIYDKLIQQSEQGALSRCDDLSKLGKLEKSIKKYIDGIVDGIITNLVGSGINQSDFYRAVDALFDAAYQQMEELQ